MGQLAHARKARSRYLRCCPRVAYELPDLPHLRNVARRAPGGPPKAEPGAEAGPAAPLGAALIRVGRHVRIPESALVEFIKAGRVEPLTVASVRGRSRGAA